MEIKFINIVARATKSVYNANNAFRDAIAIAVRKAYTARDSADRVGYPQYLLDQTPARLQPAVARELRKLGVAVDKADGTFVVGPVRDPSKQHEVLAKLADTSCIGDIIATDAPAPKTPKAIDESLTPERRARDAMAASLGRLAKVDPAAAAAGGAILGGGDAGHDKLVVDGGAVEITAEEAAELKAVLMALRATQAAAAKAPTNRQQLAALRREAIAA